MTPIRSRTFPSEFPGVELRTGTPSGPDDAARGAAPRRPGLDAVGSRRVESALRRRVLLTADGIRIDAVHHPATGGEDEVVPGLAIVVAHGFAGSWRNHNVLRIMDDLARHGGVVGFDLRGHGASGGRSTLGDREVLDLEAAIVWARYLGYTTIVTLGFSLGGSIVVRHAALGHELVPPESPAGDPAGARTLAAVITVSAPSRWFYRGTAPLRRVHFAVENPFGRLLSRIALRTRIASGGWEPVPQAPWQVVERIAPTPLLIVHGDQDHYFPLDHGEQLYEAAAEPKELWIERGFGHAENAAPSELILRIGRWIADRVAPEAATLSRAGGTPRGDSPGEDAAERRGNGRLPWPA